MYQIPSIMQFLAFHLRIYYSPLLGPNCSLLVLLANSWISSKCPSDVSSKPAVPGRLSYTLILIQPSVAFTTTLIIGLAWSFFQVFPEWFFPIHIYTYIHTHTHIYIYILHFDLDFYLLPKSESHSVMSNSLQPHGLYSPWNSPGQNNWSG